MEPLNPFPIDHDVRETFLDEMEGELHGFLCGLIEDCVEVAGDFYQELWSISWELEAYYVRYAQGFRAGREGTQ